LEISLTRKNRLVIQKQKVILVVVIVIS